jgi:hypothetical protein
MSDEPDLLTRTFDAMLRAVRGDVVPDEIVLRRQVRGRRTEIPAHLLDPPPVVIADPVADPTELGQAEGDLYLRGLGRRARAQAQGRRRR